MKNSLSLLLNTLIDFDQEEVEKIVLCFRPRSIKRNSLLLQEGEVCKEFYYISKGCMRTYFIDRNGHEKTRYVMLDCSIGTALASFISQQASVEFLETLEDTEVLAIHHADFYRLNKEMAKFQLFYQKILEMAYSFQNRRIEQLVTRTASQRYQQLLHENPTLVLRLSNKVLASYLDMREETLSRLKSK